MLEYHNESELYMYNIEENSLKKYKENYSSVLIPGQTSILASFMDTEKIRRYTFPDTRCFPYYQGKTGYCWISSALQCISQYFWNTRDKELLFDQEYLIFYDKLEKAKFFLDYVLRYRNQTINAHVNSYIFNNVMADKGQWAMAVNLIKKYGLILTDPKEESGKLKTAELNASISYLLRTYAFQMRRIWEENRALDIVDEVRERAVQTVYNLLIDFYGEIAFSEGAFFPFPFDEYVSIYVDNDAQGIQYEIECDGNMLDGKKNSFLGVSDDLFDKLIERQIALQGFCWCSGDAGKFYVKNKQTLDDSVFDFSSLGIRDILKKMDRNTIWKYHMGSMSHAMVLLTVYENSLGKFYTVYDSSRGFNQGQICRMSESWFKKFIYQGVVHRSLLPDTLVENIVVKNIVPWDFFGI